MVIKLVSHIGHSLLHRPMKPIHLNNVHTPEISKQLISVTRLYVDNKAYVEFYPTFFLVNDQKTKQLLLQGHLERGGIYKLAQPATLSSSFMSSSPLTQFFPTPLAQAFLSQKNQVVLWHNRLGHLAPKVVRQVL